MPPKQAAQGNRRRGREAEDEDAPARARRRTASAAPTATGAPPPSFTHRHRPSAGRAPAQPVVQQQQQQQQQQEEETTTGGLDFLTALVDALRSRAMGGATPSLGPDLFDVAFEAAMGAEEEGGGGGGGVEMTMGTQGLMLLRFGAVHFLLNASSMVSPQRGTPVEVMDGLETVLLVPPPPTLMPSVAEGPQPQQTHPDLRIDDDCSVCQQALAAAEEAVVRLPGCGHLFHRSCIRSWLEQAESCPLCRGNVVAAAQAASAELLRTKPTPAVPKPSSSPEPRPA